MAYTELPLLPLPRHSFSATTRSRLGTSTFPTPRGSTARPRTQWTSCSRPPCSTSTRRNALATPPPPSPEMCPPLARKMPLLSSSRGLTDHWYANFVDELPVARSHSQTTQSHSQAMSNMLKTHVHVPAQTVQFVHVGAPLSNSQLTLSLL